MSDTFQVVTLLLSTASTASSIIAAHQEDPEVEMPQQPQQQMEAPTLDKTASQEAEKLDEVQLNDDESKRRKKKAAKEKFKVAQLEPNPEVSTGIVAPEASASSGVQL